MKHTPNQVISAIFGAVILCLCLVSCDKDKETETIVVESKREAIPVSVSKAQDATTMIEVIGQGIYIQKTFEAGESEYVFKGVYSGIYTIRCTDLSATPGTIHMSYDGQEWTQESLTFTIPQTQINECE